MSVNQIDLAILNLLKSTKSPLAGTDLSIKLGISRVALWKRMHNLSLKGYKITTSRRGYLLESEDAILPHEFAPPAPVLYFFETDSTMDKAWELATQGAINGTMVTAESQNCGRGQSKRPWASPFGGLYITIILQSPLPQAWSGALVMEGAWKIISLLEESGISGVTFQWPNDLVLGIKKIGGFLVESAGSPARARCYTLGMGINILPLDLPSRPTSSLSELSANPPRRRAIAQALQYHMMNWAKTPSCDPKRWEQKLKWRSVPLEVESWTGEILSFTPGGLSPDGALLDTQEKRIIGFGESKIVRIKGE